LLGLSLFSPSAFRPGQKRTIRPPLPFQSRHPIPGLKASSRGPLKGLWLFGLQEVKAPFARLSPPSRPSVLSLPAAWHWPRSFYCRALLTSAKQLKFVLFFFPKGVFTKVLFTPRPPPSSAFFYVPRTFGRRFRYVQCCKALSPSLCFSLISLPVAGVLPLVLSNHLRFLLLRAQALSTIHQRCRRVFFLF